MERTVTAMEFRRKLGEILEGVFYRGDEVKVERNGKLMAVIVSPARYEQLSEGRRRLREMLEEVWERNKDVDPADVERDVAAAIREVRDERRRKSKRAS
jgi:prevent-host-death family protein